MTDALALCRLRESRRRRGHQRPVHRSDSASTFPKVIQPGEPAERVATVAAVSLPDSVDRLAHGFKKADSSFPQAVDKRSDALYQPGQVFGWQVEDPVIDTPVVP